MRSLPGSKRSEREVHGFAHRLQATGNRRLPTVHRQPIHPRATAQRRDVRASMRSRASLRPSRPPATGYRPPATGNRPPPSVLRPPPSGSAFICRRFFRTGECPSVVNLSVHRFPEFMRSGFFEIAPIPDPSILPRATAQRRDAQTSGKASVVSNRGELCGVSPSPAARGGGRTGGILLRSSARRHPPSVHCPPATAHRQPISRATTPRRDVQASKRSRASLRPSRVGRSPLRGHKKAPARAGALETD